MIGVLATGIVAGMLYRTAPERRAEQLIPDQTELSLATGSILFVPAAGNRCRQNTIDNATWLIREAGFIDCDHVVLTNTQAERQKFSAERAEAIRTGLLKR